MKEKNHDKHINDFTVDHLNADDVSHGFFANNISYEIVEPYKERLTNQDNIFTSGDVIAHLDAGNSYTLGIQKFKPPTATYEISIVDYVEVMPNEEDVYDDGEMAI